MATLEEYIEASKQLLLQEKPCPVPSFLWLSKKAIKTLKAKSKGKR